MARHAEQWLMATNPPPAELCWRHARRGSAVHAIVVCCWCHEWVCRRCFDDDEGVCRTCAADDVERGCEGGN